MSQKFKYSGDLCSRGVLVSFSGLNLSLGNEYTAVFDNISSFPTGNTRVSFDPKRHTLTAQAASPTLDTFFRANSDISDNSSLNLIRLSVYDSQNQLIHTEYRSIQCENLCGPGVPILPSPTPTITPTITPTVTPTVTFTPTPSQTPPPPPLSMVVSWEKYINPLGDCSNVTIRATASGTIGKTYNYQFNTDMKGVDLNISNRSGIITIFKNPTYVYTAISLPRSCQNYTLEFGLSDGFNIVQAVGVFRCGNC
jgi:hypothetical protein